MSPIWMNTLMIIKYSSFLNTCMFTHTLQSLCFSFPWPSFFEDVHKVSSKEFFWNSKSVYHLTVSIRDIFYQPPFWPHIFIFHSHLVVCLKKWNIWNLWLLMIDLFKTQEYTNTQPVRYQGNENIICHVAACHVTSEKTPLDAWERCE